MKDTFHVPPVTNYMHACINTYIRTYIHTYIHTFIQTLIHTYIHTFIPLYQYLHSFIHCYIHTFIHSNKHPSIQGVPEFPPHEFWVYQDRTEPFSNDPAVGHLQRTIFLYLGSAPQKNREWSEWSEAWPGACCVVPLHPTVEGGRSSPVTWLET